MLSRHLLKRFPSNIAPVCRNVRLPHISQRFQTPVRQIRHYIHNMPPRPSFSGSSLTISNKIFLGTATFGGVLGVIKGGLNIKNNYNRYSDRYGNPEKMNIFIALLGSMVVGSVIIFLVPPMVLICMVGRGVKILLVP